MSVSDQYPEKTSEGHFTRITAKLRLVELLLKTAPPQANLVPVQDLINLAKETWTWVDERLSDGECSS